MAKLQSHPSSTVVIFSVLRRFAIRVQVLSNEKRYKVLLDLQTCGPSQKRRQRPFVRTHINSTLDHHKSPTWFRPHGARTYGTRWLSPNVTQHTPGLRQSSFAVPLRTRLTLYHRLWQMGRATARGEMLPGARTSGATGARR
jgi:hypothetical protein